MVIWMLETLNWKQTNSIMLAGVASLGLCNYTELPNNIYQYPAVNMRSSIIERYNTNSSFLDSENVYVDLFDVIMYITIKLPHLHGKTATVQRQNCHTKNGTATLSNFCI